MASRFQIISVAGWLAIATHLTGCPASKPNANSSSTPVVATIATRPPEGLGLNERRAVEQVESESIPSYESDIKSYCSDANVKIVIDWASFGTNSDAYLKFGETPRSSPYNRGFGAAISAINETCRDGMGKKAVAEKVKAIKVSHVQGLAEGRGKFENGVLAIETDVTQDGKQPSITVLQEILAKNL
jgi:hypothetical protein